MILYDFTVDEQGHYKLPCKLESKLGKNADIGLMLSDMHYYIKFLKNQ